jgi:hypothetical protein
MATTCNAAGTEGMYPFKGRLDTVNGTFELSLRAQQGEFNLKVDRQEDSSYTAVLGVNDIHTPIFDMTTQLQGVVHVQKFDDRPEKISGRFWSEDTFIDGRPHPELSGGFSLEEDLVRIGDVVWGGFTAAGNFELDFPYPVDTRLAFEGIDIGYALDWLSGERKKFTGSGEVSGEISVSGIPGKLVVRANIISEHGHIQQLPYDLLSLRLQGIYPLVDLTNSTVTKTNGFSFDLGGTVDLSDKTNMAAQIKAIKKIPLIKDNVLQSEWVLKRAGEKDGKTETSFFLKKDKQQGGIQEDSSLLGVQKKIGF